MAFLGVVSCIGALCAPFVVELKRIHPTLPFGLMGGLAVIAALMCLVLPETRGKPTAEVYDNVNGKFRSSSTFSLSFTRKKVEPQYKATFPKNALSFASCDYRMCPRQKPTQTY